MRGALRVGGIIVKWFLQKEDVKLLAGLIWLRIGFSGGFLNLGCRKGRELLTTSARIIFPPFASAAGMIKDKPRILSVSHKKFGTVM
jgi:hypothetical protein